MVDGADCAFYQRLIAALREGCVFSVCKGFRFCEYVKKKKTYEYGWRNTWVCASTKPGSTVLPRRSISGGAMTLGSVPFLVYAFVIRPVVLSMVREILSRKVLVLGSKRVLVWSVSSAGGDAVVDWARMVDFQWCCETVNILIGCR